MEKTYEIKEYKEVDDEVISILASDETVDRDNDVILARGWSVNNWLKTGALLYGHQTHELPVGSAEGAEIRGDKLYIYSKLAKKGTSEWHDAIRSLINQKILKGVSVGFKATDFENNEYGGRTFKSQELLEVSLTPIPANANAQVLIKEYSKETQDKLIQEIEKDKPIQEEETKQEETKDVELVKEFTDLVSKIKNIIGE